MTTYSYGDGRTYYQSIIRGDLANAPGIDDWWTYQEEIYTAGREAAPFSRTDFHVVFQASPNDEPAPTRWVVDADVAGPMPTWETDEIGPALMVFRLVLTEEMYPRGDPDNPSPMGAEMQDVVTATLARAALGVDPVTMPITAHANLTFTPRTIEYSQNLWTPVVADLDAPLVGHAFYDLAPNAYYVPTLWVVPAGSTQGPMISACYDSNGSRWDDADRPVPAFAEIEV